MFCGRELNRRVTKQMVFLPDSSRLFEAFKGGQKL